MSRARSAIETEARPVWDTVNWDLAANRAYPPPGQLGPPRAALPRSGLQFTRIHKKCKYYFEPGEPGSHARPAGKVEKIADPAIHPRSNPRSHYPSLRGIIVGPHGKPYDLFHLSYA